MSLDKEQINNLEIIHYPHPVLQQVASKIETLDETVEQLALKMIDLMHQNRGVGLAGNQVAVALRIFVANPTGEEGDDRVFINPQIEETSQWAEQEEGCLSVPQIYTKIRRHRKLVVTATDLNGNTFETAGEDLLARVVQHEIDHLDGKTILDRMSKVARLSNRRQIKYLEEQAESSD